MVSVASNYDFQRVIEEFLTLKPFEGQHAHQLRNEVRARAETIFENPDVRYIPAFKLMDLLAAMVNHASAIAAEPQLRAQEAMLLLRAHIGDNAPLIRQFVLEAALERARYEPMMIAEDATNSTLSHRDRALRKRWQAMLKAHAVHAPLPDDWTTALNHSVEAVITAACFHEFRQGPLLQLFAEMLEVARRHAEKNDDLASLRASIGEQGALWKRYALKSARYGEKHTPEDDTPEHRARIPAANLPPLPNRIH